MLEALARIESLLGTHLQLDSDRWESLDINYHPPYVERVWRQMTDSYRCYLHRIHPCEAKDALFHPHPWPSAVRVLTGTYEMTIGSHHTKDLIEAKMLVTAGLHSDFRYEMIEPTGYHSVRPIDRPLMSLMVTGKPYEFPLPSTEVVPPLKPLDDKRKTEILEWFKTKYR